MKSNRLPSGINDLLVPGMVFAIHSGTQIGITPGTTATKMAEAGVPENTMLRSWVT